jgi:hypothetical protein
MKFTFKEWGMIKHCLECAERDFIDEMNKSKPSEEELSSYQIFKRQAERTREFINRIENAEL